MTRVATEAVPSGDSGCKLKFESFVQKRLQREVNTTCGFHICMCACVCTPSEESPSALRRQFNSQKLGKGHPTTMTGRMIQHHPIGILLMTIIDHQFAIKEILAYGHFLGSRRLVFHIYLISTKTLVILQIATMLSKNIYISLLVIVLSTVVIEIFNQTKPKHPYAGLNIVSTQSFFEKFILTKSQVQLVSKYGYPIETHEVVTDDGYILTLHRIPHGREKSDHRGTPVLFMHGFMQSATDFVDLGPGNALSFLLADRGYDIWLGNARGSTWGRKHKILNPDKDAAFWDYR
jgi:hypothetical protein